MNKFLFSVITASVFISGNNIFEKTKVEKKNLMITNSPQLSEEEKLQGFQLLFDGATTQGWHEYGKKTIGSAWKITDGVLGLDASLKRDGKITYGGDIVTDEEFENFHLKLEWKIEKNGNSGIMFYVHEDSVKFPRSYMTGPEMQVLDNDGHPDAKVNKHRAGDLYDLIPCIKETVRPAMEWNEVEIICDDGKLDFWLNGINVVSTTMWDDNWNRMVAASKFKQWPGFGTFKKGKICLQDHGDNVWYRNIRIKKL